MYVPPAFAEPRAAVLTAFMREHSFATVVSSEGDGLTASHLPLLLDTSAGEPGRLLGHRARANSQWRAFEGADEVLAIFHGPHAYISPSWYQSHPSVPTWNYATVHAYGRPRLVKEEPELRSLLRQLVETHEAGFEEPWRFESLPEDYLEGMMRAIVGFELTITRLEGKLKLSQNRPPEDIPGIIAALEATQGAQERQVAAMMTGGSSS